MLATLSRLKSLLYIPESDTSQDGDLAIYLEIASQAIAERCSRTFSVKEHEDVYTGYGTDTLLLRNYPVLDVERVLLEGEEIADYDLDAETGKLFRRSKWPASRRNVVVRYRAGYQLPGDDGEPIAPLLPKPLEQACLVLARMMATGEWGKESERFGPTYGVNFLKGESPEDLPPVVKSLISSHIGRMVL